MRMNEHEISNYIIQYFIRELNKRNEYYYLIPYCTFTFHNTLKPYRLTLDFVLFHIRYGLYFFEIKKIRKKIDTSIVNTIIFKQVKNYEILLENFLKKEKFPINYKLIFYEEGIESYDIQMKSYKEEVDNIINQNILTKIDKKIFFRVGEKLLENHNGFYYFSKINPIF